MYYNKPRKNNNRHYSKSNHKQKKDYHDSLVSELEQKVLKHCKGVIKTEREINYPLGKPDLLVHYIDKILYFEVKGNFNDDSYRKGVKQTRRWTNYMDNEYHAKDYFGIFVSPQVRRPLFKNGKRL